MQNVNKLSLYGGQDMLTEYGTNMSKDKSLFMRVEMCLNIYESSSYTGMPLKIQQYIDQSIKQKHMIFYYVRKIYIHLTCVFKVHILNLTLYGLCIMINLRNKNKQDALSF